MLYKCTFMKTRIKELLILTLRSQTAGSRCLADPIRACLSFSVYLSGCHKEMIFEYHTSVFLSSELLNSICFLDETTRNSQQCCKKLYNWLVLKRLHQSKTTDMNGLSFHRNASFHSSVKTSQTSFNSLFRREFSLQMKGLE